MVALTSLFTCLTLPPTSVSGSCPTLANTLAYSSLRASGLCPSCAGSWNAFSPDVRAVLSHFLQVRCQRGLPWALLIKQQRLCVPCLYCLYPFTLPYYYWVF